jgi:hypothetical protein
MSGKEQYKQQTPWAKYIFPFVKKESHLQTDLPNSCTGYPLIFSFQTYLFQSNYFTSHTILGLVYNPIGPFLNFKPISKDYL